MKKTHIISGASSLLLLVHYLVVEIACVLLCAMADVPYMLLIFWSIACILALGVYNRIITIVTYDPGRDVVTRRGLLWGFRKEIHISDIIRTEVRMIPKEQEYILLIDKEQPCFDSLSPDMPIRVPNTEKGKAFVGSFYP